MEENRIGVCMICEQQRIGGIRIITAFICDECSSEMVRTDVRDHKYPFFVKQMKKVLYTDHARTYTN
ncbi:sigma factor G inhibitor Gin [Paenibacillus sedimenti]|uniref:Sigma factor G inhibitor Gin n=1 Tax=Paenibacillus sedimenti TaxID=2770274 RepID=A0A926QMC5_9BACL|nr:sigma factor G inhibitor Gin [Paenibacillus sedimenti]MBD0384520.1 sigma factor G inhibitor Gin [Paenibacillus sedimenti]